MKTLYFIRHAKSSWQDASLPDHDRPLNKRGLRDAPRMANRLLGLDVHPDGILTSSALRTRQTADCFAQRLGCPPANIRIAEALYHAWPKTIETHIRQLPAEWHTVLVFGHNPGYTLLANEIENTNYLSNVPTCGIIGARAAITDWTTFTIAAAQRFAYLYPKQV